MLEFLDDPSRIKEIRGTFEAKPSLKLLYEEVYQKIRECLVRCPKEGITLELGSGAGFGKKRIDKLVTSDILPYSGLDLVLDGTQLPFRDQSLKLVCMLNVFHHITDPEAFLKEAERCLLPGGRLFIIDQHPGYISKPILKYFHHEPFDSSAPTWSFKSTGPLSGANGALAWLVFRRDIKLFKERFPKLNLIGYHPHTPLRYWLTGGLKSWNLLPVWAFQFATKIDIFLLSLSPNFGSFVDVEILKLN